MAIEDFNWNSPIGGNWAFMVKNQKKIGEFIRTNKIKPSVIRAITSEALPSVKAAIDLNIRGGNKVPHLHFSNKIYMLDKDLWAKFSTDIIAESTAKLAKVKEVSFEEGMLLASVAQTLVKE